MVDRDVRVLYRSLAAPQHQALQPRNRSSARQRASDQLSSL